MRILERLRHRSPDVEPGIAHLSRLTQAELAAVEADERSHRKRPVVLNRLRWLRGTEPLPGYDALESDEIVRALAGVDQATLKGVRSYERRHRDRPDVRAEIARLLPGAQRSPGEDRAREQKSALVTGRHSVRSVRRHKLAPSTARRRPGPVLTTAPDPRTLPGTSETSESACVTKRATVASASSSIGHGSTAGGAAGQDKLRELQRASDGAAARLRRAEAAAPPDRPAA